MIMRSPIVALLWEQWRLTRVEAAVRLAIGIVAASAALLLFDASATFVFWILVLSHAFVWFSLAKLNGGTFLGGYKAGFPLHLVYTRPVPTSVFVAVAMAYDAVSCAALYVVSAAVIGIAFGKPLPLFSVSLWIVTFHLGFTCILWSTRSRVLPFMAVLVFGLVLLVMLISRAVSSLQVEFSPAQYQLMVAVCLLAFGLTVAGVTRQRRGGAATTSPSRSVGYPDWMINLFRFPCPTSSATRAQVWFELRSSGLPVLTIGLAAALLIFLLFAMSVPFEGVRPFALVVTMVSLWTVPITLFIGGNAFGIRAKQGRMYASAFEATQPYGTAQMAGSKLLIRSACVLAALFMVVLSVWASSAFVNTWGVTPKGVDLGARMLQLRTELGRDFAELTGREHLLQAVLTPVFIALVVAARAAFTALRARYPRQVLVVGLLLLLYVITMLLLNLAEQKGIASEFVVNAIFRTADWIVTIAIVLATIYLFWSGFKDRALTVGYACGAVLIAVAFGVASLPAPSVGSIMDQWILPLSLLILAPWALSRIRHA